MAKNKTSEKTIIWKGSAGIEQAKKLREELLAAFRTDSIIRLDISSLEDIDITGIQLIIAARREAEKTGKNFALSGSIPQSIFSFISAVGIPLAAYATSDKGCAGENKCLTR
jgi:anti-anti-sigma regulatory factor